MSRAALDREARVPPIDAVALVQALDEQFAHRGRDLEWDRRAFQAALSEQVPSRTARQSALQDVLAEPSQLPAPLQALARAELLRMIPLNAMAMNLMRNPFKVEIES